MIHTQSKKEVSRRRFLKGTAAMASAAATAGILEAYQQPTPTIPETWDKETDVLVIGTGFAGLSTAITAKDAGAEILILEKMAKKFEGGNSRVSGNMWWTPTNHTEGLEYIEALCHGLTDKECIQALAEEMMQLNGWLEQLGIKPTRLGFFEPEHPELPGSGCVRTWNNDGISAQGKLWIPIRDQVEKRGIEILYETTARDLIQSPKTREIVGAHAVSGNSSISIKARRGVILTCGGYENDPRMKWDYLPVKPAMFLGTPGNTGDGIRMAQKIGADLWHMTRLSCLIGFKAPEYEAAFWVAFLSEGFIFVDKYGRRFVNEAGIEIHEYYQELSHFDIGKMEFPRVPLWAVFDEQTRRRGPLSRGTAGYNRDLYSWSLDNSAEIAKGWILQGKTIAELASRISTDPKALEETITRFNRHAKAGKDEDFGRPREDLRPLEPPFYAIQLWPALINTQGGPRRDKESRVLDPDGKPVPRLYAAGELGSIWGYLYQGACNIGEALVFGRIAGKNAAAEEPWS